MEFGERLYLDFTGRLRNNGVAVPVGKALVQAKQDYLAYTGVSIGGVDKKTVLIATLYGLPMFSVSLPGDPVAPPAPPPVPGTPVTASDDLTTVDTTLLPGSGSGVKSLRDRADGNLHDYSYLQGPNGTTGRPGEPVLPLKIYDAGQAEYTNTNNTTVVTTLPGVLRGVGFRSAEFTDHKDVRPLTRAPSTDYAAASPAFFSSYFYPIRPWNVNYFQLLDGAEGGTTHLMLTGSQYQSNGAAAPDGTLREYTNVGLRLYYSTNTAAAAQAAPPAIGHVIATASGNTVTFKVNVTASVYAGVQEVWVTYTGSGSLAGKWQSVPLSVPQNADDTTLWTGILPIPAGTAVDDLRYMVQAANAAGMVTMATNDGAYYVPNVDPSLPPPPPPPGVVQTKPTLAIVSLPASANYGDRIEIKAKLTAGSSGAGGQTLSFALGAETATAITGSDGQASAWLGVTATPSTNPYRVSVSFAGTPAACTLPRSSRT